MRIPVVRGVIDRRILVNFRVGPDVLAGILPPPFRPQLIHGTGMAGVCLIRLKHIRPRWLPSFLGISSENAAHRIAVEWDQDGRRREGVFIPRRDTSSRLNSLAGGRLFPGVHNHAKFDVSEQGDHYRIVLDSDDRHTHLLVEGRTAAEWPKTSTFRSLQEASAFFERGSLGYSVTHTPGQFDGLELRSFTWQATPLAVERVKSSFFEDRSLFPKGSAEFDCALLMRGIEHEWHGRESLCGSVEHRHNPKHAGAGAESGRASVVGPACRAGPGSFQGPARQAGPTPRLTLQPNPETILTPKHAPVVTAPERQS